MKLINLVAMSALILASLGFANDFGPSMNTTLPQKLKIDNKIPGKISVAYFGEFITHPGLFLGTHKGIWQSGNYTLSYNPGITLYTHSRNHNALLLSNELGNRLTSRKGRFAELMLGLGYMHTWLQGDVYVRRDNGEVRTQFDWGRPHLMISTSLGFGWKSAAEQHPQDYFLRIIAFGQYPFNGIVLPHLGLQLGTSFEFRRPR